MPNLFDVSVVWSDFFAILKYLPVTLKLTAYAMVLGLLLGFILAVIRMKRIPVLRQLLSFFISFIRGTPVIIQLYVTYFGIPILLKYISLWYNVEIQVASIPPIIYAVVALAFNQSAMNAVTIQAALEAVNKGEIEAATTLGFSPVQTLFKVIVPEAVELALPSLGNTLIGLVKGTSLAFSCAIIEMTAQGKIVASRNYRYFEAYVALAIIYWLITILLEVIIAFILKKISVPDSPEGTRKKLSLRRKQG